MVWIFNYKLFWQGTSVCLGKGLTHRVWSTQRSRLVLGRRQDMVSPGGAALLRAGCAVGPGRRRTWWEVARLRPLRAQAISVGRNGR